MSTRLNICKQSAQIEKMQLSILQSVFNKKIAPVLKKYDLELVWSMGSVCCVDNKLVERGMFESSLLQRLDKIIEGYLHKLHLQDYRNTSLWTLLTTIYEAHGSYHHSWGSQPWEKRIRPHIKGKR